MKTTLLYLFSCIIFLPSVFAQPGFMWAKQLGGADWEEGRAITLDGSGNVYTTGFFQGTADFDPGASVYNLTSAGGNDIFVSKLDAAGNFIWTKQMGGVHVNGEIGYAITVDASGNVYTTGYFSGTADFDPGAAVYNLTSGGGWDIFISKLDATGNFVWAKQMNGTGANDDVGQGITLDGSGNLYLTGSFRGTVDFNPGAAVYNLTSAGNTDIFVSKLDVAGNFVWAKQMGGATGEGGSSITVDGSGNVFTVGSFESASADFDPGAGIFIFSSAGFRDIFISKLDAAGNYVWAKQLGGTGYDDGTGITLDGSGNIYATGSFSSTVDFNPGAGIYNLTSAGSGDIFVSKLDASGNFLWAQQIGGTGSDVGTGVTLGASGNVYTTGYFSNTADFDPGAGVYNLTSAGSGDIFINELDALGNFVCAGKMGGTGNDFGAGITTDGVGNIFTTGRFYGTADFDPGAGLYNLWLAGNYEIFVSKLSACSAPLPIELIYFTADWLDEDQTDVLLQWSTASEINNDYFTLERSTDGLNFSPVASVQGAGNSSSTLNYQYIDNTLPLQNVFYYRLKQTDFNGQYSYSNIAVLARGSITVIGPSPNPIGDELNFALLSAVDGEVNIKIKDMLGQYVTMLVSDVHEGAQQIKIPLGYLAPGHYVLHVNTSDGAERISKQFVVR